MSLVIITISCKAQQIVPIEKVIDYRNTENGIPDGVYLKDVNGLLNKYIGIWKGTYENKNYSFVITTFKHDYLGISEDKLAIRYLITDTQGAVIEDTRSLPDTSIYVIKGDYFSKNLNYYMSNYIGKDSKCGQYGVVYITNVKDTDQQITLYLSPDKVLLNEYKCPSGIIKHILPVKEAMFLTKQQ